MEVEDPQMAPLQARRASGRLGGIKGEGDQTELLAAAPLLNQFAQDRWHPLNPFNPLTARSPGILPGRSRK